MAIMRNPIDLLLPEIKKKLFGFPIFGLNKVVVRLQRFTNMLQLLLTRHYKKSLKIPKK
jgi:hypothetical protein